MDKILQLQILAEKFEILKFKNNSKIKKIIFRVIVISLCSSDVSECMSTRYLRAALT